MGNYTIVPASGVRFLWNIYTFWNQAMLTP